MNNLSIISQVVILSVAASSWLNTLEALPKSHQVRPRLLGPHHSSSSSVISSEISPGIRLARDVSGKRDKVDRKPGKKESSSFKKECLVAHNKWRRMHGADELKLDPKLTSYAQSRADFIAASDGDKFEHLKDSPYGENLAWHTDLKSSCTKLAGLWYDEISLYNFSRPIFDLSTGHFTQMIWRETTKVGCAKQVSTGPQGGVYLVCNYDPPGNFVGEFRENVLPLKETVKSTTTTTTTTTTPATPRTTTTEVSRPREIGVLKPSVSSLDNNSSSSSSSSSSSTTTKKPKPKKKNKKNKNKRKKNDKRKRGNKNKNKNKNKKQQSNSTSTTTTTEDPPTRGSRSSSSSTLPSSG